MSWNRAQSECNKYGADLVSFENEAEMEWVYNIMNWNQGSSSWRYYWNGLNDLQQAGRLEWVSTSDYQPNYKFNNFGVDADMHDKSRRCTFSLFSNNLPLDYGHEGKWYKEKCEKTKGLRMVSQRLLVQRLWSIIYGLFYMVLIIWTTSFESYHQENSEILN